MNTVKNNNRSVSNNVITFSSSLYYESDPVTQLFYDSENYYKPHVLKITASVNNYDLDTFDITIDLGSSIIKDIETENIKISNYFPVANSVKIDNINGTIRIAGASCEALNLGQSIHSGNEEVIVSIDLNFVKISPGESLSNHSPLTFSITANQEETVLSKDFDDGSSMKNRIIHTLNEIEGSTKYIDKEVKLELPTFHTMSVQPGWNLIPICYDNIVSISDDYELKTKNGILSSFYGYNGSYYKVNDNKLLNGKSYWMKIDNNIDTIYFHLT